MADLRNRELAQIHIAKAQLGLDDDTYRNILWTIGRQRSAADLDFSGRQDVLRHLKACGFKPRPGNKSKTRELCNKPQHKMIRGLWLELHDMGVVLDPSEQAIQRFIKNQTRIEHMAWVNHVTSDQASKMIEILKSWRARAMKKVAVNE